MPHPIPPKTTAPTATTSTVWKRPVIWGRAGFLHLRRFFLHLDQSLRKQLLQAESIKREPLIHNQTPRMPSVSTVAPPKSIAPKTTQPQTVQAQITHLPAKSVTTSPQNRRRTGAWKFATITGTIALLLMIAWQWDNWQSSKKTTAAIATTPDKKTAPQTPRPQFPEVIVPSDLLTQFDPKIDPNNKAKSPDPIQISPSQIHPPRKPILPVNPFPIEPEPKPEQPTEPFPIQPEPEPKRPVFPVIPPTTTLSIDIQKSASTLPKRFNEPFVVTSLTEKKIRPKNVFPPQKNDDWITHNSANNIIPTQHPPTNRPAHSAPLRTALTATLTTRWPVLTARLHCEITAPQTTAPNEPFRIELRVTNTGTSTATNVKLLVDLPESIAYFRGRQLEHHVGTLPPGKTHTARLTPHGLRTTEAIVKIKATADNDLTHSQETAIRITSAQPIRQTAYQKSAPQIQPTKPTNKTIPPPRNFPSQIFHPQNISPCPPPCWSRYNY